VTASSLSSDSWFAAASLLALGVLLLLYYLHRLHRRRQSLVSETGSTTSVEDRAFNEVQIARQAARRLKGEGVEVRDATALLDRADALAARGDHREAFEAARTARESLLGAQNRPRRVATTPIPAPLTKPPSPPDGPDDLLNAVSSVVDSAPVGPARRASVEAPTSETPVSPSRPRLPRNQLEARFELTLLEEDVERGRARPRDPAAWADAERLARETRSAYDRRDFTEALRLAMRGRRRIGSRVETVGRELEGNGSKEGSVEGNAEPIPARLERKPAPARTAIPESEGVPCTSCGRPGREEDRFCRGCGASRSSPPCPACGAARHERDDRFCGDCGAAFA
jgi:hypothetical protein